jgi:hypothetical protein
MTAAMLLVGILIVSVGRPSAAGPIGPGSSAPLGTSTTGAGQAVDYHTAGAFIPTVPIWLIFGAVAITVLAIWLTLEPVPNGRRPGIIERRPWGFGWLAHTWKRRLAMLGLVALVVAAGGAASGIDALTRGALFGPLAAHYMGSTADPSSGRDTAFFRGGAGPTIGFIQSVRNQGPVPVTILGLATDPRRPWIELRIYPVNEENIVGDKPGSVPFAPITLAPGEDRQILFIVHIVLNCPDSTPAPSPEPTPNTVDFAFPPGEGGWSTVETIELRYSVLGLERTGVIEFDPVPAIWSSGNVSCGFDSDWANPSRSPAPPTSAP